MTTNNNNCVGCGCGPSIPEPCVPAPPVCLTPQACTEVLDAQCVKYTGPALTCNDVTIIPQNTSVAVALNAIVDALCDSNCCSIPVTATVQNADYVFLCLDETATCPYNGLLYNWSAINLGISGTGRAIGGIVNIDPLANPINTWRVPNDADWYALALALDPAATETPFNNIAGGPLKSTTCWSIPNSAATNLSALNIKPSVYRNPSGTFSLNNGQTGLYWSTTKILVDTASVYSLVYNDNSLFKSTLNKGHGLRIRLVRPLDCSEMAGDYIPNAYIDNAGNTYNAKAIGSLLWLTEDLRDTKFNDGTNIPITASASNWSAAASAGLCCYPDNKTNYEIVYSIGCVEKKISFEDFTSKIPTSTAKNVEVVRNWGTCVTKQEIDADNTVFSVAIEDSGWQDLLGFDDYYQGAMASRKPQVRRVGTVLHFRGDLIVPLGQSEVIIPVTDPNVLYAYEKKRRPYETLDSIDFGTGVFMDGSAIWFNNREVGPGSGPSSVIPTSVLPADVLLDNTYTCSNNIGMRKLLFLDSELNPNFLKAKANAPFDYQNQIVLTTYVNIEITQDKRLKIVPLNTLEFIGSANAPIGTRGSSVLRALTSNFYNGTYILDPKIMSAGAGESATEISTSYPILKNGSAAILPGTYVVIAGDPSDGDWSNISDIAPNTYFTSINTYGTALPAVWGSVELVDIRAYQRRPYLPSNTNDLKVWPSFQGEHAYDFFDTADLEFLGGFVFNLDNFMAFTDINNCYANFDGENSCENTPLPAEPGCCQSPFLYLMEQTYVNYIDKTGGFDVVLGEAAASGNEIAPMFDLEEITYPNVIQNTLSTGIVLNGNNITCCPDCANKPYSFGIGIDYINLYAGNEPDPNDPLDPSNLTNCCKQLQADAQTLAQFEENLPGVLNPCPTSDFTSCFEDLATILDPGYVSDLNKEGVLEINTINGKTILCDLKTFLESHPDIPTTLYSDIITSLLGSPLIIQCFPNGDVFIGGTRAYYTYLKANSETPA